MWSCCRASSAAIRAWISGWSVQSGAALSMVREYRIAETGYRIVQTAGTPGCRRIFYPVSGIRNPVLARSAIRNPRSGGRPGHDQRLKVLDQRRQALDHLVARRLVDLERAAVRVADLMVDVAGQELAKEEKVSRHRVGLDLDHGAVRLRHADDGEGLVEQPLRERLRAVGGEVDPDFHQRDDPGPGRPGAEKPFPLSRVP